MASDELLITLGLNANGFDTTLKSVKNELKRAEQEFKTAEKSLGGFENSAKGVQDKLNALERVLTAQKNLLGQYKTEIEKVSDKLKDQKTAHDQLKKKLNESNEKFERSKLLLGANADETKKLEKEVKNLERQFERSKTAINRSVDELKNLESQSRQTEIKINGLETEVEDLQREVNSFTTNQMEREFETLGTKVRNSLRGVETSLKSVSTTMKNVGSSITNAGAIMTATISAPLTLLGKKMLDLGAESQEMQNKFDVVFSTTAQDVESWASTLSKAIGRSRLEIKTAVSNSSDLLIGMGMAESQAFDLSSQFIELAYDLASFNNTTDAYAIEAMTKAMYGETEMAKGLGINLSVATMENNEFVKSLGKKWNALTQSEKAQAYLNESMKQSVNAIGDAERSSDSYTSQLKRVEGQIKDLGSEMGQILIPIATDIVTKISEVVSKFSEMGQGTQKAIIGIMGLGIVIPPLITGLGMFISAIGTITGALSTFAGAIAGLSTPVLITIGVISAVVLALITCKDTFFSMLPPVEELKLKFMDFGSSVMGSFQTLWTICQDVWNNIGKPIFDAVAMVVGSVVNVIIELLPTIADVWNTTVDIIKTVYETVFKPVFGFVAEIIQDVAKVFSDKMPIIVGIVKGAWNTIKILWESILKPIFNIIGVTVEILITVLRPLWGIFKTMVSVAFDGIAIIWTTILKPVFDAILSVIGWVVDGVSGFMTIFKNTIVNAMNVVIKPINAIIDAFDSIMSAGSNAIGWLAEKVGGIFGRSIMIDVEMGKMPSMENLSRTFEHIPTTFDAVQYDAGIYTPTSPLSRQITSGLKQTDQTTGILNNILKAVTNNNDQQKESGGITLQITNFNNNRDIDIEQLCRELEFYRKRLAY